MTDITRFSESPIYNTHLMKKVREGMAVVDVAGNHLGTVSYVSMGDPEAASNQGNDLRQPDFLNQVGMAVFGDEREPDVHPSTRAQLLRTGFIKVEGSGLFADDRYVKPDDIVDVTDEAVHLSVRKESLPKED